MKENSDETRPVVVQKYAATLRARDCDVVVFAEDAVGAMLTADGPVERDG